MDSRLLVQIKSPLVLVFQIMLNIVLAVTLLAEFGGLFFVPVAPGEDRWSYIAFLAAVGLVAAVISGVFYLYSRGIPVSLPRMIKSPTIIVWLAISGSYTFLLLCISLNAN